jgi:hypothetical protein
LESRNRQKLLETLSQSLSYRRADEGLDFLGRPELCPIRLQLELLKPELVQQEESMHSSIVVVGSARLGEPEAREIVAANHRDTSPA